MNLASATPPAKLWFVTGTSAELIKLWPLIHEAQKRDIQWRILFTGQSHDNFWNQINDFSLPREKVVTCVSGQDLRNARMAISWFGRALIRLPKTKPTPSDLWIVHGDTLSTLIGTIWGRRLGARVMHVEAGMRSHKWWSPFPEELSRRIVSRLAHIHMASDHAAAQNLAAEGIIKNVVVTESNTIVDALALILDDKTETAPYVLANIHRFENLNSGTRWKQSIELLLQVVKTHKVIFVLMPPTQERLDREPKLKDELLRAGIELRSRLPFRAFARLLTNAQFVITDGGSNQEECHYVGKPCLILRDVTERGEGLNGSCVLSHFDDAAIRDFLRDPQRYVRPPAFPKTRPTDIIFRWLGL